MHSSAPRQHSGRPQPLSVLICLDCCSLIIENNKVRSFLSCLVCCLSLWPRLSDAAACPGPAASKEGPPVVSGLWRGTPCLSPAGSNKLCVKQKKLGFQLIFTTHQKSSFFFFCQHFPNMDALLRLNSSCVSISPGIALNLDTMYHFILKAQPVHLIGIMRRPSS